MRGVPRRHVGRPRGGDPVETRRVLLDAAEECFAVAGFAGATTRQMAARAGVNVATLHYHFGSKEKLYRAVLERAIPDVALPGSGGSPGERLTSAVLALWDAGLARPSLARLTLFQRLAGPLTPEDPRARLLARTLAEPGVVSPLPPAETARLILTLLDAALFAALNTSAGEVSSPPLASDALREGIVAAALRVTGL